MKEKLIKFLTTDLRIKLRADNGFELRFSYDKAEKLKSSLREFFDKQDYFVLVDVDGLHAIHPDTPDTYYLLTDEYVDVLHTLILTKHNSKTGDYIAE